MVSWWQSIPILSRREVGAGAVAAVGALVASLIPLPILEIIPLGLSSDAQYWFGDAPEFAPLAGLVLGTGVWRRGTSQASPPEWGALAGIVTAIGTVVFVPILAGLYVMLFPVLLGLVTGEEWSYVLRVVPVHVRSSFRVARTITLSWSPLVGVVLVPLDGLLGWVYQRGSRPRGR